MVDYIPGVCNIDTSGQKKRTIFGLIGLLSGLFIIVLISLNIISLWWMILSLLLFWMGMLGIVQAKAKFCVANAAKSKYEVQGKMTSIQDNQSRLLDLKRARNLHIQAIAYAVFITGIFTIIIILIK